MIDEIRQIRHEISARFDHDPHRLVAYYMELQKQHADRLITSNRGRSPGGKTGGLIARPDSSAELRSAATVSRPVTPAKPAEWLLAVLRPVPLSPCARTLRSGRPHEAVVLVLRRFRMTMRRISVWMLAACLGLSGFAVSAGEVALFPPTCEVLQVESEIPPAVEGLFEIGWQEKSACTEACAADFQQCLDGCDSWPYPGCVNDCRYQRNLCIQECF